MYNLSYDVKVRWYCNEQDTSIKEYAEELEDLFGVPFEIVVIK